LVERVNNRNLIGWAYLYSHIVEEFLEVLVLFILFIEVLVRFQETRVDFVSLFIGVVVFSEQVIHLIQVLLRVVD
jgi:hypothetical protein